MPHPEIELARKNALAACRKNLEDLEDYTEDFLADYVMEDDEAGVYCPSQWELEILRDAVNGLMADEEFLNKVVAWRDQANLLKSLSGFDGETANHTNVTTQPGTPS